MTEYNDAMNAAHAKLKAKQDAATAEYEARVLAVDETYNSQVLRASRKRKSNRTIAKNVMVIRMNDAMKEYVADVTAADKAKDLKP